MKKRKVYVLTDEQQQRIVDAYPPHIILLAGLGIPVPLSPQEKEPINEAWKIVAEEQGFDWTTWENITEDNPGGAKISAIPLEDDKPPHIKLSKHEIQSNSTRVQRAEDLIMQLPSTHEGRNTWLLNYGVRDEAATRRELLGIRFDEDTKSAITH